MVLIVSSANPAFFRANQVKHLARGAELVKRSADLARQAAFRVPLASSPTLQVLLCAPNVLPVPPPQTILVPLLVHLALKVDSVVSLDKRPVTIATQGFTPIPIRLSLASRAA
jgi:hypothetical protein